MCQTVCCAFTYLSIYIYMIIQFNMIWYNWKVDRGKWKQSGKLVLLATLSSIQPLKQEGSSNQKKKEKKRNTNSLNVVQLKLKEKKEELSKKTENSSNIIYKMH